MPISPHATTQTQLFALQAAIHDTIKADKTRLGHVVLALDTDIVLPAILPLNELHAHASALFSRQSESTMEQRRFIIATLFARGYLGRCVVFSPHEDELEEQISHAKAVAPSDLELIEENIRIFVQKTLAGSSGAWDDSDAKGENERAELIYKAMNILERCSWFEYTLLCTLSETKRERYKTALGNLDLGKYDDLVLGNIETEFHEALAIELYRSHPVSMHEQDLDRAQTDIGIESVPESTQRDAAAVALALIHWEQQGRDPEKEQLRFVTNSPRVISWMNSSELLRSRLGIDPQSRALTVDHVGSPFRSDIYCAVCSAHPCLGFRGNMDRHKWKPEELAPSQLKEVSSNLLNLTSFPAQGTASSGRMNEQDIARLTSTFHSMDQMRIAMHLMMQQHFKRKATKVLPVLTALAKADTKENIGHQVQQTIALLNKDTIELADPLALRRRKEFIQRVAKRHSEYGFSHDSSEDRGSDTSEAPFSIIRTAYWDIGLPFWADDPLNIACQSGLEYDHSKDDIIAQAIDMVVHAPENSAHEQAVREARSMLIPSAQRQDLDGRLVFASALLLMGLWRDCRAILLAGCTPHWIAQPDSRYRASMLFRISCIHESCFISGSTGKIDTQYASVLERFRVFFNRESVFALEDNACTVCFAMLKLAEAQSAAFPFVKWFQQSGAKLPGSSILAAREARHACRIWLDRADSSSQEGSVSRVFVRGMAMWAAGLDDNKDEFERCVREFLDEEAAPKRRHRMIPSITLYSRLLQIARIATARAAVIEDNAPIIFRFSYERVSDAMPVLDDALNSINSGYSLRGTGASSDGSSPISFCPLRNAIFGLAIMLAKTPGVG